MATVRDVAKESGVSVATVSYVLNNGPRPVRPETRKRVLDAIRRLDYHPNAMARGLVSRRIHTLGVLFGIVEPAIVTNPYASSVLEGVLTVAAETGFNITLFTKPWQDSANAAGVFRDGRTDGVLLVAPLLDNGMLPGLANLGIPVVAVSASGVEYGVPSVDVDNALGARMATEHLIRLGHRRIAHITGDANQPSVSLRVEAYSRALCDAGIEPKAQYLVAGKYNGTIAYECARHLLSLPEPPTAIFTGNDVMAFGAIEAAVDHGFRVPEDLSIVGFDDIPAASWTRPSLTTVRQPLARLGEIGTQLLVNRVIGGEVAPELHMESPTLIERDSAVPPRAHC